MGNPKAFLEIHRQEAGYRPIHDRIHDFGEVEQTLSTRQRREQASRCMDCGVPFCHWACPLGNKPPEWNDALYKGEWELAYRLLSATNPFPEFTGRICPALCEKACVLNLFSHEPTTNREDEAAITEGAFREGYIQPRIPARRIMTTAPASPALAASSALATSPAAATPAELSAGPAPASAGSPAGPAPVRVAVIGAGPAGLAAANALNQLGYTVTVFEKNEAAGGLLRYGIPNFKLNKAIIDRRLRLLEQEGIEFRYGVKASPSQQASPSPSKGGDVEIHNSADFPNASGNQTSPPLERLRVGALAGMGLGEAFDAYIIATGTPTARDLNIPGRDLKGVHLALELLSQQNRVLAGMEFPKDERITARGKDVLVIGGGDTGSDCIGTAHRQGARSVTQIEIMPRPVEGPVDPKNPWPGYPRTLKTTSSHEEGCTRRWNINTLEFLGKDGRLTGVRVQEIEWQPATVPAGSPAGTPARPVMVPKGEPFVIKAELCLLAMGFLKPEHPQYPENVFVCGDAANGASLVVRAMASGIETAKKVDAYLTSHL